MNDFLKESLWKQFGAALDMLKYTINACPDSLWETTIYEDSDDIRYGQFWYVSYHSLVWLDLFLTGSMEGFTPPTPFIRGKLPDTPYTKAQVMTYLQDCRQKAQTIMQSLTTEHAQQVCKFPWMEPTFFELQMYSMRHLQEHTAQLSLVLGKNAVTELDWIPQAES